MADFQQLEQYYKSLDKVALRVECHLADSVVNTGGIHLDAILGYAVVERETQGAMLDTQNYVRIPLPLAILWESRTGIPLYASTDLLPDDKAITSLRYWHRRAIEPSMTHKNIRTSAGRHKERRTPMQVTEGVLCADVIGNLEEIALLLQNVSAVGKKRTAAGAVREWKIYQITEFSLLNNQRKALRPIPLKYVTDKVTNHIDQEFAWIGYSPPYWHVATRGVVIPTGAVVL